MELGLTHLSVDELSEARLWLDRARRDYTGYLLETIVHFRVHCAMRTIKAKQQISASQESSPISETAHEAQEMDTQEPELNNSGVNTRISSMFIELSKKMSFASIGGTPSPTNITREYEEFLDGYQNKL